ncbi:MAG: hypothetical protein ACFFAE_22005, partial [Candidatus Hodarchaeota archaeon]
MKILAQTSEPLTAQAILDSLIILDPRSSKILDLLNYIIRIQREDGGWGFDVQSDSSVYYTGLALHALKLAFLAPLHLTSYEQQKIVRARSFGLQFILAPENCHRKGKTVYWCLQIEEEEPDPTLTLYAMWALCEESINQYQDLIQGGVHFLRNALQEKDTWELRPVVTETSTKYGAHKVVVSFTPS